MATITRKAKGSKWIAIYTDATGKQKWKTGYMDKAETQRLADRLEDEARRIRLGDIDPQAETRRVERAKSLAQHVNEYRAKMQAAGLTAGQVAYTIGDITALMDYAVEHGTPLASASAITRPLVDRWQLAQQRQQQDGVKGNSNKTINRRVSSVQALLRHLATPAIGALTACVLDDYPMLPTGQAHKTRQSRALTADELAKLLGPTTPEDRRDRYTVAVRTGLRHLELRQMIAPWFDTKRKRIDIPAHVAKPGVDQSIPMHASIAPIVKRISKTIGNNSPLFPMPTKQHVINQIRRDAKAAGIDNPDSLGFHTLRHTFCTMLAERIRNPAKLHKLTRHQDLKTTMAYYVHVTDTDELDGINML